jgi:serine protease Do
MKQLPRLKFACMSFLLLGLVAGLVVLPSLAQNQTPETVPVVPSVSSPATPANPAKGCEDLKLPMEQMERELRTIECVTIDGEIAQQMAKNLANLSERVQKEVEMSSPEMQRLQSLSAQLRDNQGQFGSNANELATRAAELADLAQEKVAAVQVFGKLNDDDGGWLGIEIGEVTAVKAKDLKLTAVRGVVVMDVEPDGPAAKAGLKENDVITEYDAQTVEGTVQFRRLVLETPAGRTVALVISRNGITQSVSVDLGERSSFFEKKMKGKMRDLDNAYSFSMPNQDFAFVMPSMDSRTPSLGIGAEDLSGQLGSYFGAPDGSGILIREVRAGTAAEKAGLKAGDVIIKVDGKAVHSLADLRGELRDKSEQKSVNLGILRKGSETSVPVPIEKAQPTESTHVIHRAQL